MKPEEKELLKEYRKLIKKKEKKEIGIIQKCTTPKEAENLAVSYEAKSKAVFEDYDKAYPKEGSLENEVYLDKIDYFQNLLKYAKAKRQSLIIEENR